MKTSKESKISYINEIHPSESVFSPRWQPSQGEETLRLINGLHISDDEKGTLLDQSIDILSCCTAPNEKNLQSSKTGLVVGFVQSGKTMSFTALISLARDNNFPIVFLIAGNANNLFEQSNERLRRDLKLNERDDRQWYVLDNPASNVENINHLNEILRDWKDSSLSKEMKQTILFIVMKNHKHLSNLSKLLSKLELQGILSLFIDDEADQASMNTKVRLGQESTTYQKLNSLRSFFPHHTYLQYTATPQAPLLISIIDNLSPDFVRVLTPGKNYVGGKDFFKENSPYLLTIPPEDIPPEDETVFDAPSSLKDAMRIFFVGVAAAYALSTSPPGNRSMMVHPSRKTGDHVFYKRWVNDIKRSWDLILKSDKDEDSSKEELLKEFEFAYFELKKTVLNIPDCKTVFSQLLFAIRRTRVLEVNTRKGGKTPNVNWRDAFSHILIGGQSMDRGFTVEGLTVTYMPRGIGVGNADTIQQRARFFGYKRNYLGFCRIFLSPDTMHAYIDYLNHEQNIHEQLIRLESNFGDLKSWKRVFFLSPDLKPTRKNVLSSDYIHDSFSDSWFFPKHPHSLSESDLSYNRSLIKEFLSNLNLKENAGHSKRTEYQIHLEGNCFLEEIYEKLLVDFRMHDSTDSLNYTGILLQISEYLEKDKALRCRVVQMRPRAPQAVERKISEQGTADGAISNPFQGAHPSKDNKNYKVGEIYPGDREIKDHDHITVQFHEFTLTKKREEQSGFVTYPSVPVIAIWVPKKFENYWVASPFA